MKKYIDALVEYALSRGLIGPGDEIYAYNALLAALKLDAAGGEGTAEGLTLAEILSAIITIIFIVKKRSTYHY